MGSSLILQQCPSCLACLTWMVLEIIVSGRTAVVVSLDVAFRIFFSKYLEAFLYSSHLAFSLCVLLASMWCIHTVSLTPT